MNILKKLGWKDYRNRWDFREIRIDLITLAIIGMAITIFKGLV